MDTLTEMTREEVIQHCSEEYKILDRRYRVKMPNDTPYYGYANKLLDELDLNVPLKIRSNLASKLKWDWLLEDIPMESNPVLDHGLDEFIKYIDRKYPHHREDENTL